MRGGADARRSAIELAGLRARGLDQVVERFERKRGIGDENERQRADLGRRLEIAHQQHRQVGAQRFVDGVGAGREQHGVAVGLRPRHRAQRGHAAARGLRVDQHLLAPGFREFLAEQSGHCVGTRTYHDEHRAARKVLRVRREGEQRHHHGERGPRS
jgi:hypothetical protein